MPIIGLLINLRVLDSNCSSLWDRSEGFTERFFVLDYSPSLGSPGGGSWSFVICFSRACLTISLIFFCWSQFFLVFWHPDFRVIAGIAKILDQLLLILVLLLSDCLEFMQLFHFGGQDHEVARASSHARRCLPACGEHPYSAPLILLCINLHYIFLKCCARLEVVVHAVLLHSACNTYMYVTLMVSAHACRWSWLPASGECPYSAPLILIYITKMLCKARGYPVGYSTLIHVHVHAYF